MARYPTAGLIGLAIFASSASAATVGPIKGRPVAGRPLEVNIPFAVDDARERACASANVRYGNAPVKGSMLDVQGQGLKRNLLVTSRAHVSDPTVRVDVRVGCGAKAVSRSFVLVASTPGGRGPAVAEPAVKKVSEVATTRAAPKALALATPAEPLFPPSAPEAAPAVSEAPRTDAWMTEELRKVRAEAATAMAQLAATRKELAAVLDVERRTSQTLINAEHQVRNAKSEVGRMRALLAWIGAGLGLGAAGLAWLEFQRVLARRRPSREQPQQEPMILSGSEMAT